MKQKEEVFYTIYRCKDLSPVKVFKKRGWAFEKRFSLHAEIIGKSHRIIFYANGECFTEYIAYPIKNMTPNPMDCFPLEAGKSYFKKYGDEDLACQVNIHVSSTVFEDMDGFLNSIGKSPDLEILQYRFKTGYSELGEAFTGIVLDILSNQFYTVHNYPEKGFSILSKSKIDYSNTTSII